MKRLILAAAVASTLALSACGGGGGGTTSTTPTSTSGVGSLGRFSENTVVQYTNPADGSLLGTGKIGADGKFTISLPTGYTGPVGVTVVGATGVTYYDEGTKQNEPFGPGKTLRAYMPSPQSQVGVTALTNAAAAKADANAKIPSHPTADEIRLANTKVAAAFGYTDGASILEMPTIVDGTTKIGASTPADKYALLLAALAKTAPTGSTAVDVMAGLASDLKSDDYLDGVENTGSNTPTSITSYTLTTTTLAKAYDAEAADLISDENELRFAENTPPKINYDVSKIIPVSNASDVSLAKTMFADLRTTLNAFSNGSKTGFLDTQAAKMHSDLNANVTPEMTKISGRISALGKTMGVYEDGKAGLLSTGTNPLTGATTLVRVSGDPSAVMYGYGSYNYCWTDSATTSAITKSTCAHAGADSFDWAKSRIKMVVFEYNPANQPNYTATRYDMAVTFTNNQPSFGAITLAKDSQNNALPAGSGTVAKTVSGTTVTGLTLNGTLPPSTPLTGVDTVAISAARSALTGTNYRYALSGSVATTQTGSSNTVTLSFDNGSYIDLDEGTNPSTNDAKMVAAKLIGTAQTLATRFTGTLTVGAFMTNADGQNYTPTSVVFDGSLSDLSSGGAGQFLTGKLEGALANYGQYHSTQPDSNSNYIHTTFTFTGTVQAPSRPLMTLVVAAAKSGLTTEAVTLNYTYGTTSITGSGTHDSANPANNTLTLSNQNGIQVNVVTGAVTKSGASVATITSGTINYVDGVTESLM